jgi:hypothetical protein
MTRGLAFWILMLLWLVLGIAHRFALLGEYGVWGIALVPFLLLLLVGWQVFGPPLR